MNHRLQKIISILMPAGIALLAPNAFAYKAVGWHWYNELPFVKDKKEWQKKEKQLEQQKKQKEQREQTNVAQNEQEKSSTTAVAEMKHLREVVEEAKARAILTPTETNIRDYVVLQNYIATKATMFSQVWQKVLLDYPRLDYRVSYPTQNGAQAIVYSEQRKKEDEAIRFFGERYGLFFFYRGNNPIDQELAKVVDTFVRENNISLKPISIDGKVIDIFAGFTGFVDPSSPTNFIDYANRTGFSDSSGFNNSAATYIIPAASTNHADGVDHGQAKKLGIEYFPALILVDPKTRKIRPLNYGFISGVELRTRFLQVATDFRDGV